jgi:hypothetical protein
MHVVALDELNILDGRLIIPRSSILSNGAAKGAGGKDELAIEQDINTLRIKQISLSGMIRD